MVRVRTAHPTFALRDKFRGDVRWAAPASRAAGAARDAGAAHRTSPRNLSRKANVGCAVRTRTIPYTRTPKAAPREGLPFWQCRALNARVRAFKEATIESAARPITGRAKQQD